MSDHYPIGYIPPVDPAEGLDRLRKEMLQTKFELMTELYRACPTNGCAGYWQIKALREGE